MPILTLQRAHAARAALVLLAGLALLGSGPARAQDAPAYRLYVSNEYGADITVLDGKSYETIGTIPVSGRPGEVRPRGMTVSPDGATIYVAVSDFMPRRQTPEDKIVAIGVANDEIVQQFEAGGNPERVALSPDGKQLWASLEAQGQGAAYDVATGKELARFPAGVEPEGVGVSPDGRWAYITSETTHTVAIIDARALKAEKFLLVGNRPRVVRFSDDSKRAYISAEIGGTVSVIDVEQQKVIDTISLGLDARPVGMALSPDGSTLYVAGGGTSAVYVIDTASRKVTATITDKMGRRPWGIAVSPDGSRVFTANGLSDSVSVIDTSCNCVVDNVKAGRGPHSVVIGRVP